MTKTTKITKKERYNAIIAALTPLEGMSDLIDFCEDEIALLEKKAAKAKAAAATKKTEVDPLTEAVKACLTEDFQPIAQITEAIDASLEPTASKVSTRLSAFVKAGVAEDTTISVPVTGGKARKLKAYRIVVAD